MHTFHAAVVFSLYTGFDFRIWRKHGGPLGFRPPRLEFSPSSPGDVPDMFGANGPWNPVGDGAKARRASVHITKSSSMLASTVCRRRGNGSGWAVCHVNSTTRLALHSI